MSGNPCSEILLADAKKTFDLARAIDQYGIRERYIQNARPFDYNYRGNYDTPQSDIAWFTAVMYDRDKINDRRDLEKFLHGAKLAFSHTLELLVQAKSLMEEHLAEVENPELDVQVTALQKKIDQWKSSGTIN